MQYQDLSIQQQRYVDAILIYMSKNDMDIDESTVYSRALLRAVSLDLKGRIWIPNWITHDQSRRVDRGVFRIPEVFQGMEQGEEETAGVQGSLVVDLGDRKAVFVGLDDEAIEEFNVA
jgi:hypothetical protein